MAASIKIDARFRLANAVMRAGGSLAAAAKLHCSRAFIDMIIAGDRVPGIKVAYAISKVFGIPMGAWAPHEWKAKFKMPVV